MANVLSNLVETFFAPYHMFIVQDSCFVKHSGSIVEITGDYLHQFSIVSESDAILVLFDKSRNVSLFIDKHELSVMYFILGDWYPLYHNGTLLRSSLPSTPSKIAVVTLFTPNYQYVCKHSEANIRAYCNLYGYSCYVYHDTLIDKDVHPTWNKPIVLLNHILHHDYIMWIDSDAIFTNFDTSIEEIIPDTDKDLLLCDDIGGWTFNAGVQIWKNTPWSRSTIIDWWNTEHVGHMQGGDQVQLINITKKSDPWKKHHAILPQRTFNSHPDVHRRGDFILHMMGKSGDDRIAAFTHWNKLLNIAH